MIRSLYTAVSGMITQEAKQDVISNNLANANTIGFKQDNLSVSRFDDVLIQNYDKQQGGQNVQNIIGKLSLGSKIDGVNTDFTEGSIENTGVPTDFAINGKGFFTLSNNGTSYYSRDGHFHVDSRGYLTNDSGYNVMAKNTLTSKVEPVYVGNAQISSDANGNISLDGKPTYKLETVDFANYSTLRKIGDNLYTGGNAIAANVNVSQNSLENSNVNLTSTMIDMLTTMRSFETDQKVVQSIDETLDKAVNDVGVVK
jgi:flagellar basal-body rod protein FlgF